MDSEFSGLGTVVAVICGRRCATVVLARASGRKWQQPKLPGS